MRAQIILGLLCLLASCAPEAAIHPVIRKACAPPHGTTLAQFQQLTGQSGMLHHSDSLSSYYEFLDGNGGRYLVIVREGQVLGLID